MILKRKPTDSPYQQLTMKKTQKCIRWTRFLYYIWPKSQISTPGMFYFKGSVWKEANFLGKILCRGRSGETDELREGSAVTGASCSCQVTGLFLAPTSSGTQSVTPSTQENSQGNTALPCLGRDGRR